jgi:hypothetical protein
MQITNAKQLLISLVNMVCTPLEKPWNLNIALENPGIVWRAPGKPWKLIS